MISRLLAKSWDYPDIAKPESVFLDRHLRDVVLCASSIASTTEDYQLGCFGLDPNIYRERFRKILLVSAACHGLGKANSHFQEILSPRQSNSKPRVRQAVRHEWVTWFVLCQKEMKSWIQGNLDQAYSDIDWHLIL
jgi:hypothetical protein